jgi:hypothetical protein
MYETSAMRQRFVIALVREARRAGESIDLEKLIEEFSDIQIIERSIGGETLMVEMPLGLEQTLRDRFPFAIVEPEIELSLL